MELRCWLNLRTILLMPLVSSIDNGIRLNSNTKGLDHEMLIADKALVRSSVHLNIILCGLGTHRAGCC